MQEKKIYIEKKYRGTLNFPQTKDVNNIFFRVKQAYANHEEMSVKLLFSNNKLHKLKQYQKGSSQEELLNLDFYIELGQCLDFNIQDAVRLKNSIILTNDTAHTSFNITKRLKLINKKHKSNAMQSYLFWDIENFSSISSIFSEIIDKYEINDSDIFMAANPDSLYLKKAEWEANLYDYGKTLHSFNFIKCDHGKNVADDVLLQEFQDAKLQNSNVFILTFDRELKERFTEVTHISNNLFIMLK